MTLFISKSLSYLPNKISYHYINKNNNKRPIYTSRIRKNKSLDLIILDVYITKDYKISIFQPELMKFGDIIAQIDEEIQLSKLLGVKDV